MNKFHDRKWLLAATAAVGALTAGPVCAQTPSDGGNEIETVVVTARRVSEKLQDIPTAITAVTPQALAAANIQTPMGLQFITPGLQTTQNVGDATNVKFKIRGQSSASGFLESSVGVYIDGVYLQLQNGLNAAMFDLERVEVLKGPQGTLYGKNTTGGVINIITKKPDLDAFGAYLTVGSGGYLTDGAHGTTANIETAVNVPIIPGTLAARISALYDHSSGYGHDALGRKLNDRNNPYVRVHLLYRPTDDLKILLSADHGAMQGHGASQPNAEAAPGSLATAIGLAAGAPAATATAVGVGYLRADIDDGRYYDMHTKSWLASDLRQTNASLTADYDVNDDVHVRSISAYRKLRRFGVGDTSGAPFPGVFQTSTSDRTKFYSQELDLYGLALDGRLNWQTGVFYSKFHDDYGGVPGIGLQTLVPITRTATFQTGSKKSTSLGAFVQGVWHVTDKLDLTTGVRWSKDKREAQDASQVVSPDLRTILRCTLPTSSPANGCLGPKEQFSKAAVTYEIAAAYHFTDAFMAYATHRKGFRAGDFNPVSGQTLAFLPEYVKDYEVGFKSTWWHNRILVNLAAYYSDYKDIQRSQNIISPITNAPVNTVTNAASATVKGVELETRFRVIDNLDVSANYTYTYPHYDKWLERIGTTNTFKDRSEEAWEIATHAVTLSGNYRIPLASGDRITLSANYYYQSGAVIIGTAPDVFRHDPTLWQPGYGLFGARITYSFDKLNMDVSLIGKNLGDKHYLVASSCSRNVGRCFVQPGEPRFVGVEVTKRFGAF